MEKMLKFWKNQTQLFSENSNRNSILHLDTGNGDCVSKYNINVWRNHNFENIVPVVDKYSSHFGVEYDMNMYDYDDTLAFIGHKNSDIELVWFDIKRLKGKLQASQIDEYLITRINALREISNSPILLMILDDERVVNKSRYANIPSLGIINIHEIEFEKGLQLDEKRESLLGTRIGKDTQYELAIKLACSYLPAFLQPALKAIAVDLDNTLHKGVLGEDGVNGVIITNAHLRLQDKLKELKKNGIFLALISRNEIEDVKNLFQVRKDYPLSLDDFSAIEVSWDQKSVAMGRIAEKLRISTDSILYIDDNTGELFNVRSAYQNIKTIIASEDDANATYLATENYPGLFRWTVSEDDKKRALDLKANEERSALLDRSRNLEDYFKALGTKLIFTCDDNHPPKRIAELCSKTNQFNMSLKRTNEIEVSNLSKDPDSSVSYVTLTDNITDSGIIAVLLAYLRNDELIVSELCISCRAMGRELESTIIVNAISGMNIYKSCKKIVFEYADGPRNQPAKKWIEEFGGKACSEGYFFDKSVFEKFKPVSGVFLEK